MAYIKKAETSKMATRNTNTIESLTRRLDYANKRVAFAWAKYYSVVNADLHEAHATYATYTRVVSEDALPEHIKSEMREMATALKKKWECPCCLDMIDDGDLEITNCGHFYCKGCLTTLKQTQKTAGKEKWECAVCRRKHNYKEDE